MEALLEREADVENWNDDRLDELSGRMDEGFKEMREGFAQLDRRFEQAEQRFATKEEVNRRFDKVDHELARINDRLDKQTYSILGILGAFAATTVAAVIGNAIL